MISGVTRRGLPHLPGIPYLHINRPLQSFDQNILNLENLLF